MTDINKTPPEVELLTTPPPATTPWVPMWPLGVDAIPNAQKAQPNGVATLDASGLVPVAQLPVSAISYRKTTPKAVNNIVAETDLLNGEITIAAGVMGTNKMLRLTALGDYLNNYARVSMPRFKLKLGATTIFDTGVPTGDTTLTATRGGLRIIAEIANVAVNVQSASFNYYINAPGNGGGGAAAPVTFVTGEGVSYGSAAAGSMLIWGNAWNSAAVDTTAAQALVLSVINNAANALYEVKLYSALVEII